jgi:hypothetical protein
MNAELKVRRSNSRRLFIYEKKMSQHIRAETKLTKESVLQSLVGKFSHSRRNVLVQQSDLQLS